MVTPMTRTLSITYGTFEVGGSTAYRIDGGYQLDLTGDRVRLEYSFFVVATSAADFKARIAAIETAFSNTREAVVIKVGGQTIHDYDPADGSGTDAFVTLSKGTDDADTGRSRRYSVIIDMGREDATTSGAGGAREVTVSCVYDPSRRRTVTISGEYVNGAGGTASTRYAAGIGALPTSAMTHLSITVYEIGDDEFEYNTADTICRFRRVVDEIIFGQPSAGPVDHPSIVRQTLLLTRTESAQSDQGAGASTAVRIGTRAGVGSTVATGTTAPLLTLVDLTYECSVRADLTKDLKGLWDGTIKGAVVARARSVFAAATAAVLEESVTLNQDYNRIQAKMTLQLASRGTVLSSRLETEDSIKKGNTLIPVLTADRNPYAKYLFRGPGQILRRITETVSVVDATFTPPFTDAYPEEVAPPTGDAAGAVTTGAVIDVRESRSKRKIGIVGQQLDVLDYTCETIVEFYAPYQGAGAGAPGSKLA